MKTNFLCLTLTVLAFTVLLSCEKTAIGSNDSVQSSSTEDGLADSVLLTKNLVAFYTFNKNLKDTSNHGHDGTAIGKAQYLNDRLGNPKSALKLGGTRVVTDNFFNFQRTDSFTVACWFKLTSNDGQGRLMSTECPEGNFRIGSTGTGAGVYAIGFGSNYVLDTVKLSHWYHLAFVYKKRGVKVYRNGELILQGRDNGTDPITTCAPFTIGAKASADYDMWQGAIDDLKIYKTALSAKQVDYLYTH